MRNVQMMIRLKPGCGQQSPRDELWELIVEGISYVESVSRDVLVSEGRRLGNHFHAGGQSVELCICDDRGQVAARERYCD